MKTQLSRIGCIALLITGAVTVNQQAQAQSNVFNAFTYQGRITSVDPSWVDDPRHWDFWIKAVIPPFPCFGTDCGWFTNCPDCTTFDLGTNSVFVDKGLFTMPIVIPPQLLNTSNGLYLLFAVRTNGGGAFTTLWPAQQVTATPFASIAQSVSGPIQASSLIGTMPTGMITGTFSSPVNFNNPSNIFAGDGSLLTHIQAGSLIGAMPTGMITGTFSSPVNFSNPSNIFAGDGVLLTHVNATTVGGLDPCNLPCYWNVLGNSGTDPSINFLGTTDNEPLTLKVHNQTVMRYFPHPVGPDGGNLVGGAYVNLISGGAGSVICGGGGVAGNLPLANVVSNDHSAIVGGLANLINGRECFIGGGWGNTNDNLNSHCIVIAGGSNNAVSSDFGVIGGGANNVVGGVGAFVGGGLFNEVVGGSGVIAGGQGNHIEDQWNFIGGGEGNSIDRSGGMPDPILNVIGGGWSNTVSGAWSTIGGGGINKILLSTQGHSATIAGGYANLANGVWAAIGGGAGNTAGPAGFVGGGWGNFATGNGSVVAGGTNNTASGAGAAIPGGLTNTASGSTSFAAGNRAKAVNDGAFVWADSQNADFASTANNQFAVRAENGVMIQGTATTLDLRGDGAIRVAGAGVGSAGPVFIHRASNASISGHITTIDHPLANGDPNAILLVTHNFSADTSGTPYEPNTVGVWYNGSRWTIYHENTAVAMPVGRAFNVMVIKP